MPQDILRGALPESLLALKPGKDDDDLAGSGATLGAVLPLPALKMVTQCFDLVFDSVIITKRQGCFNKKI